MGRRRRIISLTQVQKKGLQNKQRIIEEIRQAVKTYDTIFLFSFSNMRNNKLKELRVKWRDHSRFFLAKNRLLSVGFGRTPDTEIAPNLHQISRHLIGERGILFTNQTYKYVIKFFKHFKGIDFAKPGNRAIETIELKAGGLDQFSHNMESQLKKLGMPVMLNRGVPTLYKDYLLCQEGDILNASQTRVMKHLGLKQSIFKITLEYVWTKEDGKFEILDSKVHTSLQEKVMKRQQQIKAKIKPKKVRGPTIKEQFDNESEKEDNDDSDGWSDMDDDASEEDGDESAMGEAEEMEKSDDEVVEEEEEVVVVKAKSKNKKKAKC